jgi:hypothetical protein
VSRWAFAPTRTCGCDAAQQAYAIRPVGRSWPRRHSFLRHVGRGIRCNACTAGSGVMAQRAQGRAASDSLPPTFLRRLRAGRTARRCLPGPAADERANPHHR